MPTTLFSFLGKVTNPGAPKRYRNANYVFPDGSREQTEYLGTALAHNLDTDTLVILGTSGSMWDVLVETLFSGEGHEQERLTLMEAADNDAVTQDQLETVQPIISEGAGREVRLQLIPYGRDTREQLDILDCMARHVPDDQVTIAIDITHGLRYMPMLSMLSAEYLKTVRGVQLKGLYYGAYELMDGDEVSVLELNGLSQLAEWLTAIRNYDKDGDYGVFVPLLRREGLPEDRVRCLEDAAYYERVLNLGAAQQKLNTFLPALDAPLQGPAGLFAGPLRERLAWAHENDRGNQQWRQAELHRERGDFARAALFGTEAFISSLIPKDGKVADSRERDKYKEEFKNKKNKSKREAEQLEAFREIGAIRNSVAHGTRPNKNQRNAVKALGDPEQLRARLGELFKVLQSR